MSGTGTPIRLVQESGRRIELMANELQITTNRKVGQIPLPFSGSKRFGMDFNMNNCTVMASGIIVDDKTAIDSTLGPKAVIDFSRDANTSDSYRALYPNQIITSLFSNAEGIYTAANISSDYDGAYIKLTNSADVDFFIRLNDSTGTDAVATVSGQHIVDVFLRSITGYGSSDTTWKTNFITTLAGVINNGSFTLSTGYASSTTMSAHFTASAVSGLDTTGSNYALQIVADDTETDITVTSPSVFQTTSAPTGVNGTRPPSNQYPIVTKFPTDIISTRLRRQSAGDKVQNLVGIMNNSNNQSALGLRGIGAFLKDIVALWPGGDPFGANQASSRAANDYIMGIEIPFKSFVNAAAGQDSDVRIFHMPTGGFKKADDKGATAAKTPGQILSDNTNDFVGMDGAVQSLDMNYSAGETVYNFTLTFIPVDFLL